jgi:hypothetical protein
MLSEEEKLVQEFVDGLQEAEAMAHQPAAEWQDWIPDRLIPDTMMGLAMTRHYMTTPARERV